MKLSTTKCDTACSITQSGVVASLDPVRSEVLSSKYLRKMFAELGYDESYVEQLRTLDRNELLDELRNSPSDKNILYIVSHKIIVKKMTVSKAIISLPPTVNVVDFLTNLVEVPHVASFVLTYCRETYLKDETLMKKLIELLLLTRTFDPQQAFDEMKREGFDSRTAFTHVITCSYRQPVSDFLDNVVKELTVDEIADILLTHGIAHWPRFSIWLMRNEFNWNSIYNRLDEEDLATINRIINNQV